MSIRVIEYVWLGIGLIGVIVSLTLALTARHELHQVIQIGSGLAWRMIAKAHRRRESLRCVVQSLFTVVGLLSLMRPNSEDVEVASQRFFLIALLVVAQALIVLNSFLDLRNKRAVRNYLGEGEPT